MSLREGLLRALTHPVESYQIVRDQRQLELPSCCVKRKRYRKSGPPFSSSGSTARGLNKCQDVLVQAGIDQFPGHNAPPLFHPPL